MYEKQKNGTIYASRKPSDGRRAAFGFCRDNEQLVCVADNEHEVRSCE